MQKEIYGVKTVGSNADKRQYTTRIGHAKLANNGDIILEFDYFPAPRRDGTIHIRLQDKKTEAAG
jgi:hypothetical protein